jgi:hypothetical protein
MAPSLGTCKKHSAMAPSSAALPGWLFFCLPHGAGLSAWPHCRTNFDHNTVIWRPVTTTDNWQLICCLVALAGDGESASCCYGAMAVAAGSMRQAVTPGKLPQLVTRMISLTSAAGSLILDGVTVCYARSFRRSALLPADPRPNWTTRRVAMEGYRPSSSPRREFARSAVPLKSCQLPEYPDVPSTLGSSSCAS